MMNGDVGSMMGWMMGFGLLGWAVISLLVAILIVLVRLLGRSAGGRTGDTHRERRYDKPLQER